MNAPILTVRGLTKRFGGLVANADIDLEVRAHEAHAVIGPNGAGKTTLVAQVAGELAPSAGTIAFAGADVTALSVDRRSKLGLARTFQITSVLKSFTVLENVAVAAQSRAAHSYRFWSPAAADEAVNTRALAALARVGLRHRAEVSAAGLSHGEQRQLEIAMALATAPKLLLLDEPTAGMGREESQAVAALLAELKRDHGLLLVEHDMDVVFSIADRITVLVGGRVIASGPPEAIRADAKVRAAYLGEV